MSAGTELAGDVTMPGGAKVPKKVLVIGGGAAAAFIGYRWWSARSAAAVDPAADPAAAGDAYGLAGGSPDVSSGVAYGAGASSASPYTAADPSTLPPADNGTWVQRATAYLTGLGWDPGTVSSALGRWMTGDFQEGDRGVVEAALGAFGRPPQAAPGVPAPKATTPTTSTKSPHQIHEDHLAHEAHLAAQAHTPKPAPKPATTRNVSGATLAKRKTVPAPAPRQQPTPATPKPAPKPAPTTRNVSSKTIAKRGK